MMRFIIANNHWIAYHLSESLIFLQGEISWGFCILEGNVVVFVNICVYNNSEYRTKLIKRFNFI